MTLSTGEYAFGVAVGFAIAMSPTVAAVVLAARSSKRSVEEWKLIAWIPPLPLVIWWVYLAIAALRGKVANLWPFGMVFCLAISVVLFIAFFVGRKLSGSNERLKDWRH
jgi:hypothetical protein